MMRLSLFAAVTAVAAEAKNQNYQFTQTRTQSSSVSEAVSRLYTTVTGEEAPGLEQMLSQVGTRLENYLSEFPEDQVENARNMLAQVYLDARSAMNSVSDEELEILSQVYAQTTDLGETMLAQVLNEEAAFALAQISDVFSE